MLFTGKVFDIELVNKITFSDGTEGYAVRINKDILTRVESKDGSGLAVSKVGVMIEGKLIASDSNGKGNIRFTIGKDGEAYVIYSPMKYANIGIRTRESVLEHAL